MLRHALAKSEIERLKAIRARDEAAEFWKGELRSRTAERDAAIRERESWKLLADRTNERLSAAEARVAELEAASGGREGAPDAWGVVRDGNVQSVMHRLFCNKAGDIAEKTGGTVVPLYRAPARNEAVRAAEDGRTGTLPTPGECIVAPFAEAAERSSTASKTGEGQSGLRTERVTLEVTHGNPWRITAWEWSYILRLGTGESVRVVEEPVGSVDDRAYADRMGCDEERDFANRILAERDAAIREREKLECRFAIVERRERFWFAQSELRESALKKTEARVAELEAASGGGRGEPVAWMCEWTDHTSLHRLKTDAEDEAHGTVVPQPLYRSPPQPRGWLTESERELIGKLRKNVAAIHLLHVERDANGFAEAVQQSVKTVDSLLARSTPPEVEIPDIFFARLSVEEIGQLTAALAAAGVAVKEGK
jgi:hypothetical protein